MDLAHAMAYKIMGKASGYTYRPALVQVLIATDLIDGSEYHRQLDARDVRFAAELGLVLR